MECRSRCVNTITGEQRAKAAEKMKKMQKEGEKLIKGMFEFTDAQGGWFDFSYRLYPGEPIRTIRINHGEICDIPLDVAKLLNNCYKKIRTMPEDLDNGNPQVVRTSRTRFIQMDLLDPQLAA